MGEGDVITYPRAQISIGAPYCAFMSTSGARYLFERRYTNCWNV